MSAIIKLEFSDVTEDQMQSLTAFINSDANKFDKDNHDESGYDNVASITSAECFSGVPPTYTVKIKFQTTKTSQNIPARASALVLVRLMAVLDHLDHSALS